ncbi:hypothetical protein IAD21_00575 [Abditibacteriota bacterium]|nr:hypothetical protein IAD21_00575 [Abditibacteriota bacterium]
MIESNGFTVNSRPGWIGDFLNRDAVLAGGAKIDAALFKSADAVKVTVGANAAADATSLTVAALSKPIPIGSVLDFGGKKFARLTAAAAKGATTLTVAALATALVTNDVAYYSAPGEPKRIASGTLVGATNAEIDAATVVTSGVPAGLKWGPAADGDDVVYLIIYDVIDADKNNNIELYRHGRIVKINNLPSFSGLSNTLKGKVRSSYECTIGATES